MATAKKSIKKAGETPEVETAQKRIGKVDYDEVSDAELTDENESLSVEDIVDRLVSEAVMNYEKNKAQHIVDRVLVGVEQSAEVIACLLAHPEVKPHIASIKLMLGNQPAAPKKAGKAAEPTRDEFLDMIVETLDRRKGATHSSGQLTDANPNLAEWWNQKKHPELTRNLREALEARGVTVKGKGRGTTYSMK